jgi:hypothetical protein
VVVGERPVRRRRRHLGAKWPRREESGCQDTAKKAADGGRGARFLFFSRLRLDWAFGAFSLVILWAFGQGFTRPVA